MRRTSAAICRAIYEWKLTLRARFTYFASLDDDVLVSPYAPDLFRQVPCAKLGAVVEAYHKQVRVRGRVRVRTLG